MPHVTLAPQHPAAVLDHAVTVAGLDDGETLSGTPTVTVASGLTLTPSGKPAPAVVGDAAVVFWLTGGTSGRRYEGEISCATSESRLAVVTWSILILDQSPNA